ncbi:hypothetical protein B0H66DRAFT_333201 [Apodospora peruviana]|uniref:Uncharacterized protein n=1 Tax=Apodospora peruviana TaxID=516989 RepID=A0AAE0HYB2_9PEZI|nr:hypothetical protein B0H66DRAFT_333201 [Apodospora peruviana]
MRNWWAKDGFKGEARAIIPASSSQTKAVRASRAQSPSQDNMADMESPTAAASDQESRSAVLNGTTPPEEEDDNINELTPPPDTPVEAAVEEDASGEPVDEPVEEPAEELANEIMSRTSSAPVNTLEDEIVVGTNANNSNNTTTPQHIVSESEDVEMDDAEDLSIIEQVPKRKRVVSQYTDLTEGSVEPPAVRETPEPPRQRIVRPTKTHGMGGVKGVTLGYWRDSEPADPKNKHSVIGFIDVRDRLRTRIQPTTQDGRNITHDYPLPPGPGGSWVTFEKVAFDRPLVNLDHYQVKEYVKVRAETLRKDETPEEKRRLDDEAVKEAIRRVKANPPPETNVPVAIAYGATIPEHAQMANRPEPKRRRVAGNLGGPSPGPTAVTNTQPLDNIPGTRPTRILLGYWKQSSELDPVNKHAVYGILGANDMFRVKLTRETRDGRQVQGNFPQGAGALWIHWDEVEFEPHLKHLTRPEIKEYCRVRQRQIDQGETVEDRIANETKAVYEGQQRARHIGAPAVAPPRNDDTGNNMHHPALAPMPHGGEGTLDDGCPLHNHNTNGNNHLTQPSPTQIITSRDETLALPEVEYFRTRRPDRRSQNRQSLPDVELRAANRPQSIDPLERTNTIARREIARVEEAQRRADQRNASREVSVASGGGLALPPGSGPGYAPPGQGYQHAAAGTPTGSRMIFQDNVNRLNKVWAAQEANRMRAGDDDAKMYMGVKYERKQNGPFQGKLVSQGTIISIDGEDYVEYRVLTKPSFF